MSVFEFDDYKKYLKTRIEQMPKGGRGELQRISRYLNIHSTRFSHVFHGHEHLTLEQGIGLTRYFGMNELESEYFMILLQWAKAGNEELKTFFLKKKAQLQGRASQLVERLTADRKLTESEKAVFYSNWFYSAIRLACSLPEKQNIDTLSARFALPRERVSEALEFLMATGLCVQSPNGRIKTGVKSTHLEARSPLVSRLHANWRIKAMERHPSLSSEELGFTSPMSIEEKDALAIRETLIQMIEKASAYADTKRADSLYCLNVDWFRF
jgi:uncharacterized protein (TIGR02147 family)